MLNFNSDLDSAPTTRAVQAHRAEVPPVQERVTVTPLGEASKPVPAPEPSTPAKTSIHVPASASSFEWEKVRDYVIEQILALHGPFPRDVRRENTIFMGFAARWEDQAMPIARYAFEEADGEWLDAPVGVARFHKTSDGVFAQKIAAKL